jgi:MFS family permease
MALEETPVFLQLSKSSQNTEGPLLTNFRDPQIRKRMFLLFFCISAGGAVLFFCVQVYTSIFLKTSLNISPKIVDQLSMLGTAALFPLTVFAGWLSDKIGRKPVVLSGLFLGAILIQPAFHLMQFIVTQFSLDDLNMGMAWALTLIMAGLSLPLALVVGPQTALLAELFPAKSRNSAATLPHNLAAGWIGGLLPLIVTWINQKWGSDLAGLWYPTLFLSAAFLLALLYLPETKDVQLTK